APLCRLRIDNGATGGNAFFAGRLTRALASRDVLRDSGKHGLYSGEGQRTQQNSTQQMMPTKLHGTTSRIARAEANHAVVDAAMRTRAPAAQRIARASQFMA